MDQSYIANTIYYFLDSNKNLIDTGIKIVVKFFPDHNGAQWLTFPLDAHHQAIDWLINEKKYNMENYYFVNNNEYLKQQKIVFSITPKNKIIITI